MSKHTPGPWMECGTNGVGSYRICASGAQVATVDTADDDETGAANARLIAAAPTMTDELTTGIEFVEMIAANWDNGGDLAEAVQNAVEWAENARAALVAAGVAT